MDQHSIRQLDLGDRLEALLAKLKNKIVGHPFLCEVYFDDETVPLLVQMGRGGCELDVEFSRGHRYARVYAPRGNALLFYYCISCDEWHLGDPKDPPPPQISWEQPDASPAQIGLSMELW